MLIKYGPEQWLLDLMNKGAMFFNPAQTFRDIEEKQQLKGQGDKHDSGLHSISKDISIIYQDQSINLNQEIDCSFIIERAKKTPVFCLKKATDEFITAKERSILKKQFPNHSHALIIDDESRFLENVRYSFKSRAFAHSVFYQDNFYLDFCEFLHSGCSDIKFYPTRRKNRCFAKIRFEDNDGAVIRDFVIDDSNFYKTMYRKGVDFRNQQEYRIVLPHVQINEGKLFRIKPFQARLKRIDDLVVND